MNEFDDLIMKYLNVTPANGRLGIMIVGNGAVATTFMGGVLLAGIIMGLVSAGVFGAINLF